AWVESLRQLKRSFGNPADVEELYRVFKKLGEVLGRGRSGDPAALALSVAADPTRVKLAHILAKSLEVATGLGWTAREGEATSGKFGEFEVTYGSIERLRHAAMSTRLMFMGAPLLFFQRLAAAALLIKRTLAAGDRGVYLLVDKSGSMYGAVGDIQKIVLATAYALAVLKRRRDVVLRFFDVEIHEETTDLESLVEVLTRVVAGGGTDITRAILAAVEDGEKKKRRYVLHVVTDGEDDHFDPTAVREARRVFRDVVFVLIGGRKLEGVKTVLLKRPGGAVEATGGVTTPTQGAVGARGAAFSQLY
ncbi:MAG: VWA domain-containing protein, partial [Pyrobaculum sp.]